MTTMMSSCTEEVKYKDATRVERGKYGRQKDREQSIIIGIILTPARR